MINLPVGVHCVSYPGRQGDHRMDASNERTDGRWLEGLRGIQTKEFIERIPSDLDSYLSLHSLKGKLQSS